MNPSRTIIYLLIVTAVLFAPLLILFRLYRDREVPSQRPRSWPVSFSEEPEPPPELPSPETKKPVVRRELAIEGRVFDSNLEPVGGGVVSLGEKAEKAELGPEGTFDFPAAVRPRQLQLTLEIDGQPPVSFPSVLAGDRESAAGEPEAGADPFQILSPQPSVLRWTINLSSTEPAEPSAELSLTPGAVLIEDWGRGARVQVQGRSNLPDGADVLCNLDFDGFKALATFSSSEVRDGVWTAMLYAPKTSHIYSGRYEVVPTFNSLLAPDKVEKWRQSAPAGTWDQIREVTGRRSIFVGDPAEALEEDRAVEAYYQRLLVEARRLHQGLESRIREILDDGKGWDPALLRAREEARAGWFRESFVDTEGNLRVDRWRKFVDERWRPAVRLLREEHRARPDKKYIEAENRLEELLTALLQMSQVYSLFFVYPLFHVPSHPNDYYVDEREGKDLGLLKKIVEEDLFHLQRFCYLVPE